jgi:hypothetical protein
MILTGKAYDTPLASSPKAINSTFQVCPQLDSNTAPAKATQDNSINQCCFACGAWQEDIENVLHCPSDQRALAQGKAKTQFLDHLTSIICPHQWPKLSWQLLTNG